MYSRQKLVFFSRENSRLALTRPPTPRRPVCIRTRHRRHAHCHAASPSFRKSVGSSVKCTRARTSVCEGTTTTANGSSSRRVSLPSRLFRVALRHRPGLFHHPSTRHTEFKGHRITTHNLKAAPHTYADKRIPLRSSLFTPRAMRACIYSLSCCDPFGGAMASRARETRRRGGRWGRRGGRTAPHEREADKMSSLPFFSCH